ncbi:MAG: hypothetical protein M0Z53_07350 [Thermaerobacter sp.]|nr:hypothetical protein [Thermaerobacter sp.]
MTAYHDAWHIEHPVGQMKPTAWLWWTPRFHRTDDKISVPFLCALVVTLVNLLRRECARGGIEQSVTELLDEWTTIHEGRYPFPRRVGQHACLTLTDRTPRPQQLLDLLAMPETHAIVR